MNNYKDIPNKVIESLHKMSIFDTDNCDDKEGIDEPAETESALGSDISHLVNQIETEVLKEDSGSKKLIERFCHAIDAIQGRKNDEIELMDDIEEFAVDFLDPNKDRTQVPNFDVNYSKLLKIVRSRPDYSFYEKLRSCFDVEEMFSPDNIKSVEEDDAIIMDDLDIAPDANLSFFIGNKESGMVYVDEDSYSSIQSVDRFNSSGKIYSNPYGNLKLGQHNHIKNVSDYTIMLPCGNALKPFHLMELNSILKIDQKTINSFKEDNDKFLEHVKLGHIKVCTRRDVKLLNKHIKSKEFLVNDSDDLVGSSYIYETLVSLLRNSGMYNLYLTILKERYPDTDDCEIDITDKIRTASSIFANDGVEFPELSKKTSLPASSPSDWGKPLIKRAKDDSSPEAPSA